MANEMTTSHTHKKAKEVLDRVLADLEVDRGPLLRRNEEAAVAYIEEVLDAVINGWDDARTEAVREAGETHNEALDQILALQAKLEEVKAQRDAAEAKVDRLTGRED
jgi:hypothetical protein